MSSESIAATFCSLLGAEDIDILSFRASEHEAGPKTGEYWKIRVVEWWLGLEGGGG